MKFRPPLHHDDASRRLALSPDASARHARGSER
ncbi:hypothetical protein BJ960_000671 [Leucobacter aridicollis]|uniref:Uncharacterized protein n=1 Tax=Leucobacter aridicollis TaxID=283878 RepID=A0A852R4G8_9MICO|nr:hypothetical protein [Leucobacter aridicollis]